MDRIRIRQIWLYGPVTYRISHGGKVLAFANNDTLAAWITRIIRSLTP